ncbi:MAG: hypothetical protein NZM35_11520, partial [Chitinophagales bacterium]|nr:hypothetical protein [Chitinophagales bacterium]
LFTLLIGLAIQGHFINDWGDLRADCLSGKHNLLSGLPDAWLPALMPGIIAVNLLIGLTLSNKIILLCVIVQTLLNVLYSLHPMRLKERGLAAAVVTGLHERALPYFIILLHIGVFKKWVFFSVCYIFWGFVWEIRNFLKGQSEDAQADALAGVRSIALTYGQTRIQRWMHTLLTAELVLLVVWQGYLFSFMQHKIIYALALIVFCSLYLFRHRVSDMRSLMPAADYLNVHALSGAAAIAIINIHNTSSLFFLLYFVLFPNKLILPTLLLIVPFALYIRGQLIHLYYAVRRPLSYFVNYTIYYFRLYVLRWPEEKARSDKRNKAG